MAVAGSRLIIERLPAAIAAAIGLVLFFTGALIVHISARVFYNLAFPGTFWLLATASLVLAIGR